MSNPIGEIFFPATDPNALFGGVKVEFDLRSEAERDLRAREAIFPGMGPQAARGIEDELESRRFEFEAGAVLDHFTRD